ncbi:MAG: VWA domain-containing protein, partial [Marmoricola sp.]
MSDSPGALLHAVDRAALAASFGARMRRAGATVPTTALADLCEALGATSPSRVDELYWSMRVTLVRRQPDLETFDRVFDAAFRDADLGGDPHARRRGVGGPQEEPPGRLVSVPGPQRPPADSEGSSLPWHTLPRSTPEDDTAEDAVFLPELLPSGLTGMADTPFDEFDEAQLALLGRWLERAAPRWPVRRSRRARTGRRGESIALRPTIAASGGAGFEPLLDLRRERRVDRPRPLTLVTDVSASMQSYSAAYLHLMRAFARTGRAETFAFSTSLTRLT